MEKEWRRIGEGLEKDSNATTKIVTNKPDDTDRRKAQSLRHQRPTL